MRIVSEPVWNYGIVLAGFDAASAGVGVLAMKKL